MFSRGSALQDPRFKKNWFPLRSRLVFKDSFDRVLERQAFSVRLRLPFFTAWACSVARSQDQNSHAVILHLPSIFEIFAEPPCGSSRGTALVLFHSSIQKRTDRSGADLGAMELWQASAIHQAKLSGATDRNRFRWSEGSGLRWPKPQIIDCERGKRVAKARQKSRRGILPRLDCSGEGSCVRSWRLRPLRRLHREPRQKLR